MHKPLRTLVSVAVLGIIATHAAYSAGFSLYSESNAVVLGNYAAGVAAEASDASIGWYNPAGLVLIHEQQAVFSGVGIFPKSSLSGTTQYVLTEEPVFPPPFPQVYDESFSNLTSEVNAFVPAFHYALPLSDALTVGLSITAPFGLATDWGPTSPVRYEATYSELITTNISPQFGARINENYSVGAGLDFQYARVKFNSIVGVPALYASQGGDAPSTLDSLVYNKGTSYGVGFHAGIMGMFHDNHTRVGLNYQSKMRHTFYGYSRLSGQLATTELSTNFPAGVYTSNNLYSNGIDLPDILTLSGYQDVTERFSVLGSVVFTGWNVFKNIQLNNVAAFVASPSGQVQQILVNLTTPENYKNTWRVGLGGNYHVNEQWMIRVGGGYDQTPTNNIDRDVRLPDCDRWALAVGAHYQMKYSVGLDLGYTHLFGINNGGVNRVDKVGEYSFFTVNANSSSSANLVGLQLVWTIDKEPEAPMK